MSPVSFRPAKLMFAFFQAINPCDLYGRILAEAASLTLDAMPFCPVLPDPHPDLFEAADGAVEVLP